MDGEYSEPTTDINCETKVAKKSARKVTIKQEPTVIGDTVTTTGRKKRTRAKPYTDAIIPVSTPVASAPSYDDFFDDFPYEFLEDTYSDTQAYHESIYRPVVTPVNRGLNRSVVDNILRSYKALCKMC